MNGHLQRVLIAMLIVWLAAVTCSLPTATPAAVAPPAVSQQDLANTAAVLVLTAQVPAAAAATTGPVAQPAPPATATTCSAMVTANLNANVRSGPGTDYDAVGALLQGSSAPVSGKNDAGTWWYIDFAAGAGGHAWIANSVTTASCVPAGLIIVAAPPTEVSEAPSGAQADLRIDEFSITPSTPVMGHAAHVRLMVYNHGSAPTGPYAVVWYGLSTFASPSCSWNVPNSNPSGGRVLECDYTFQSWYPVNKASWAMVDVNDQVDESNEGNNEATISPFGVTAH